MTQLAKEEDLNHLSFLREVSLLKEGEKIEKSPQKRAAKTPLKTNLKTTEEKLKSPLQEKLSFLNIPFKPVLEGELQKEVEEKFPSSSKAEPLFKEQDIFEEEEKGLDKKKWDFPFSFFNKRRKVQVKYLKAKHMQIPVVKKEIISSNKIVDSRSLLVFSSSWIKTIFADKILFKAIPATGTNLLMFPKGHYFFVQFVYQATPIHPTQEMIHQKLSPLKVFVFRDFKSFRNWVYEQMREIEGVGFKI